MQGDKQEPLLNCGIYGEEADAHDRLTDDEREDRKLWFDSRAIGDVSKGVQTRLLIVVGICSFFIVAEYIGAYISQSIAIFTDVAHLLSDLIGFILSLLSVYLGTRRSTDRHSYGFIRAEMLGALFSVIFIWILTAYIFYIAVEKLISGNYEGFKPFEMLVTALFAMAVNLLMAYCLHGVPGHSHGGQPCHHGHDHSHAHKHEHEHEHDHEHSSSGLGHDLEAPDHHHQSRATEPNFIIPQSKIRRLSLDFAQAPPKPSHEVEHETSPEISTAEPDHEHRPENVPEVREERNESKPLVTGVLTDAQKEKLERRIKKNLSVVNVENSHNIRAAWIHILGDIVQSVGVCIGATVIYFNQDWKFIDPCLSILFSLIALSFSLPVFRDVVNLLLDVTPKSLDLKNFKKEILAVRYLISIHDLHVWEMAYGKPAMTLHVLCSKHQSYVLKKVTLLARQRGIYHSTIQVEVKQDKFKVNCDHNVHFDNDLPPKSRKESRKHNHEHSHEKGANHSHEH